MSTEPMEKSFDPRVVEARLQGFWEKGGWFAPQGSGDPYCIMIPPPNVTGTLHMGHAFQHTLMDSLTRYHRMLGRDTLWQPGTDHAGIATQMVVERNLRLEGTTRLDLGRENFVKRVWEWKAQSGGTIEGQIRRMGNSVDWSRNAFTMNPDYSRAVVEHFVRLYDEGLIYRGKRLVNWDPVLQTAISDLEVVSEEENGRLWHIRYPVAGTALHLTVATTRPETMLGDTAVAVHPDDERFQHLIGQKVALPLCDREIPIIADTYVDREFGTGVVKITPGHDFNDYAVGARHKLPIINIFTPEGRLKADELDDFTFRAKAPRVRNIQEADQAMVGPSTHELIPAPYRGLDRFDARKRIVADLETQGFLVKVEEHKLKVPRGDRTGVVLEPFLTDQWFVDLTRTTRYDGKPGPGGLLAITNPAIKAVESGRIKFVPENWSATYFQWLRNIQDWCISRQIWWGHRIPAWYDHKGSIYVARTPYEAFLKFLTAGGNAGTVERAGLKPSDTTEEINQKLEELGFDQRMRLTQDNDVFDTWFSSDIWPLATLGWPEPTPALKKFYPGNVLVTGFDIIFFWVARMVMMGLKLHGDIPFHEVYVHGLIRDPDGQKMSKSKGNVLDPLDLVDGIGLEDLVKKRTTGLMKPETAPKIERATRKDYPKGIAPVGVDALRFTFAALASPGRDIRFDAGRAEGYRNFCNKLWNAANYVLMNVQGHDCGVDDALPVTLGTADRWIISRLQKVEAEVAEHFRGYRFDLLAQVLYHFAWNEFCDWYIELSKPALREGDTQAQRGTRRTLVRVLETLLRLMHPLMPFVTEDIWQRVSKPAGKAGPTIMTQAYPVADKSRIDEAAEADIAWLQAFVLGVRQIRGELDISPAKPLPVLMQHATQPDVDRMARLKSLVMFLARIEEPYFLEATEQPPQASAALLGEMKILVPLKGLIDPAAELARIEKQTARYDQDIQGLEARIGNPNFAKAPPNVQDGARTMLEQKRRELAALKQQEDRIRSL